MNINIVPKVGENVSDLEVIKEFKGGQKPEALVKRIIENYDVDCLYLKHYHQ